MRTTRRTGFTLYELLVILALLALLAAFFFPAIFQARRAANRAASTNNLKQIGLALHNYHDTHRKLPPGNDDNNFSAAVKLLPFIEQDNLYRQIDFKKSVDDKANAAVRKTIVNVYLSPNDPRRFVEDDPTKRFGATNYLFAAGTKPSLEKNNGAFFQNSNMKLANFADGLSNTVWVAETLKGDGQTKAVTVQRQHIAYKADALKNLKDEAGVADWKAGKNIAGNRCASWMDGRFLQGTFTGTRKPNDEKPDVDCGGKGGLSGPRSLADSFPVLMGDGSVRFINAKKISLKTWQAAITAAGGEVLGNDF